MKEGQAAASAKRTRRNALVMTEEMVLSRSVTQLDCNVNLGKSLVRQRTSPIIRGNKFVPRGLPQDPEQQSLAFFMTNFTHDRRREEIWGGSLEALPTLFKKAEAKSPLTAAVTTTAMGSIAWSPGHSGFRTQSIQIYGTSLKRISESLTDPEQSQSDNVLMAVLMLGFYEVRHPSYANIKSLTLQRSARGLHTKGAVALIKARKPQSFHNQTSLRLYLAVRAQLLGQCIENGDPTPFEDFLAATEGSLPEDFVPSCADHLALLSMSLPKLHLREKRMLDETNIVAKHAAAQNLLKDAQEADLVLDFWTSTVPEEYQFISLPLREDIRKSGIILDMYPQSLDIYCDHPMANTWNIWRIRRINVLRMIMNCADILKPAHSANLPSTEYQNALQIIRRLANEICSSVPFHLGYDKKRFRDRAAFADYPHPPGEAKWPENFAASGAVGGWLMMQPLSFVAKLDCIPETQRDWVREYLTTFMRDPKDMGKGPKSPPLP
ncbi:MAG: hypothetical protein Q9217_006871 [Psora testacea]